MTKTDGDREKRFEFAEKFRTVARRIRENGIQFFRAPAFDAEYLGASAMAVVPGWQRFASVFRRSE